MKGPKNPIRDLEFIFTIFYLTLAPLKSFPQPCQALSDPAKPALSAICTEGRAKEGAQSDKRRRAGMEI